jgi:ATP-dependent DNA helicase DinG
MSGAVKRSSKHLRPRQFFRRGGILSKWHPNYEFREGQLAMAEAVESALTERRHLIVEAGTGTGKTLAYLIPAILSGKRVVVSTGTKNLQEQLFFKDIPFLEKHLDVPLRVCYMKGRNNFACRQKIYETSKMPVLAGLEEVADFEIIRNWEQGTDTGDRAEIRTLPENSGTRSTHAAICAAVRNASSLIAVLSRACTSARSTATSSSSITTSFSPTSPSKRRSWGRSSRTTRP